MWSFKSFKLLGKLKFSLANTHLLTLEKDDKFKSLSCQVRNNMETTLHVSDNKFHKPGK